MDIEEGRIVPGELQEKCVCSEHFSDSELQGIIRRDGRRGICSYCGEKSLVMDITVRMTRVSGC